MEEVRTQRALCITKIDKCIARTSRAIGDGKERVINMGKDELLKLQELFDKLHVATVTKERSRLEDADNQSLYDEVTDKIQDQLDDIEDFMWKQKDVEAAEEMARKLEEFETESRRILKELSNMERSIKELKKGPEEDYTAELLAVSSSIAMSDKALDKCKLLHAYILEHEKKAEVRKERLTQMANLELKIRDDQRKLKALIHRSKAGSKAPSRSASPARSMTAAVGDPPDPPERPPGGSSSRSDGSGFHGFQSFDRELNHRRRTMFDEAATQIINPAGSGERPDMPLETSTNPFDPNFKDPAATEDRNREVIGEIRSSTPQFNRNVFKTKSLEYPKFSGDIRTYSVFKRDFTIVVSQSKMFTTEQLSLLLRNECLSGPAKKIVENIYDYEEIWAKLDDLYDDEPKVVAMITKQISSFKEIGEDNMDALVEFVELLEKAYFDLRAFKSTDVLSNVMTVELIVGKCPQWVQKQLVADMARHKVDRRNQFEFIRSELSEIKKQARQLSRYSSRQPQRAVEGKSKGKGSANLTVGSSPKSGGSKGGSKKGGGGQKSGGGSGGSGGGSGGLVGNGVAAPAVATGQAGSTWKCYVPTCSYGQRHMFSDCRAWKKMDASQRGKVVLDRKLCVLCFSGSHDVASCPRKASWKKCDVNGCDKWHSRMLHGANVAGLVLTATGRCDVMGEDTLLLIQDIPVAGTQKRCITFWDSGATIALVTFAFAEECGLVGQACSFMLTGVGGHETNMSTRLFNVPLMDRDGRIHYIHAVGIERITNTGVNRHMAAAVAEMEGVSDSEVLIDPGDVDLLVGMGNMSIMPTKIAIKGELALFSSKFGSGKLLGGSLGGAGGQRLVGVAEGAELVAHTESSRIKLDFLSSEAYGVDVPRRCLTCRGCKECNFKNSQITFEELTELTNIESKLVLDVQAKKWATEYSYKQDPSILQDNYSQAFACMASLERRLVKTKQLESYDEQFLENVERGVFRKVSDEELQAYTGPVNYISIVEAFKEGPHSTTPLRLCMNSSLKYKGLSLNDILMKGPAALNDILNVTLGFRSHQCAVIKDISKFYQSVLVGPRDQHLRRVLHRKGAHQDRPDIYKTMTVNFGDKIAGCISQCALRDTARMFREIDPDAAEKIISDSYVDDTISGASSRGRAEEMSSNMDLIASQGGFKYKESIISGDPAGSEPRKVLGLGWQSDTDTVYVGTKVNISSKRKGVKEMPDIGLEELVEKFPEHLTKRMVWRVALGQYDILGLISVFTVRLKLIMKVLVEEMAGIEEKKKWDQPVSKNTRDEFLAILQQLLLLKKTEFPRCVVPVGYDSSELPMLLVLADGSQSAYCALVYLRSKMLDGTFSCRLVMGKTRVAPTKKISIPRMELMAALTAVRLAKTVEAGLRLETGGRRFFTDNSAVLGMIRRPSGAFQEFVGTRVGEIVSKSDTEEWFWIPTHENLADMGTRRFVTPDDLASGSEYQLGKEWMCRDEEEWPVKQEPGKVPDEELQPAARVNVARGEQEDLFNLAKFATMEQAIRRVAWVKVCCVHWRKSTDGRSAVAAPDVSALAWSERYLLNQAQVKVVEDVEKHKLDSLRPQYEAGSSGGEPLVVTGGRLGKKMLIGYDKCNLPMIYSSHIIARLYMQEAHNIEHCGADRTLQRSREKVWIIRGRKLAQKVVNHCFTCKRRNKKLHGQMMAQVHESRVPPAPVFGWTSVDMFGPIKIRDTVRKRVSMDCWGVLFCCTITTAIHLEVSEDYSTDRLLGCIIRFINLRGAPFRIMSDPGTQMIAAAEIVRSWDCSRIPGRSGRNRIEWHVVPTASQHFNGSAEAMVKVVKRQLTTVMKERLLTKGELDTVFSDVMEIVNSRPLASSATTDPEAGGPVTPNHLLLGRASAETPDMNCDMKASLTKRMRFLQSIKKEFWSKWINQVFPKLMPTYKWRRATRNLLVGDVVLMQKESELTNKYRLAVVKRADPDEDGMTRKVLLSYYNTDPGVTYKRGGYPEKTTERAVHGLVVVVPADYIDDRDTGLALGCN